MWCNPNKIIIEYVTMDMWKPYKDAVNTVLPHAKVVVDKGQTLKKKVRQTLQLHSNFRYVQRGIWKLEIA